MGRKCPTGKLGRGLLVSTRVQSGHPLLPLETSLERPLGFRRVMGLCIVSHGCVWGWDVVAPP